MCSSKPPKPKQNPPPRPDPPTELLLDEAGSKRRDLRSRAGQLRAGRKGLRYGVSTGAPPVSSGISIYTPPTPWISPNPPAKSHWNKNLAI